MTEGSFEYLLTSRLLVSGDGTRSAGMSNPFIIRKDEMNWLTETLRRIGTTDYSKIKQAANAGDDEANRIVGFCETAYHFALYKRCHDTSNFSFFVVDQFLNATQV